MIRGLLQGPRPGAEQGDGGGEEHQAPDRKPQPLGLGSCGLAGVVLLSSMGASRPATTPKVRCPIARRRSRRLPVITVTPPCGRTTAPHRSTWSRPADCNSARRPDVTKLLPCSHLPAPCYLTGRSIMLLGTEADQSDRTIPRKTQWHLSTCPSGLCAYVLYPASAARCGLSNQRRPRISRRTREPPGCMRSTCGKPPPTSSSSMIRSGKN